MLSHAHIDHSGYLPRLVKDGFGGPIYCIKGTASLLKIMLPDAAHLQEEEAAFANRHRTSRHDPALPLFTSQDAERVLGRVKTADFGEHFAPLSGVQARFTPAGHILGAAVVECEIGGRRVVFSGDLGRYAVPILVDPTPVREADVLLVESTYGDRLHPAGEPAAELVASVHRAVGHNAWLLIPAFAVGRAQQILYHLRRLEEAGRIPSVPVYLDSPMAIQATVAYAAHTEEHDVDLAALETSGARPFAPRRLFLARTVEDSKRLNGTDGPGIILAGSGMATGGASSTTSSACCPTHAPRCSSSATRPRARGADCCKTAPVRSGCSAQTSPCALRSGRPTPTRPTRIAARSSAGSAGSIARQT